jgi:hypothetical protein
MDPANYSLEAKEKSAERDKEKGIEKRNIQASA